MLSGETHSLATVSPITPAEASRLPLEGMNLHAVPVREWADALTVSVEPGNVGPVEHAHNRRLEIGHAKNPVAVSKLL